jgi:integrase
MVYLRSKQRKQGDKMSLIKHKRITAPPVITAETLASFAARLRREERAENTVAAYVRAAGEFMLFLGGAPVTQDAAVAWKADLRRRLAPASVNAAIAGANALFAFIGAAAHLKPLKLQRRDSLPAGKLLTRVDVDRLLSASSGGRLHYVVRTLVCTGIRVGELRFVTVEALREKEIVVTNKGKTRTVYLPARSSAS